MPSAGLFSRRQFATNMSTLIAMLSGIGSVGNTRYVDSVSGSDASGRGTTLSNPLASINYAVGLCTASNGDVVVALPGHVETVTTAPTGSHAAAAGQLNIDVVGVKVLGLGVGATQATVNLTTATTANVRINAASVWVEGLTFTGGIDNITTVLTINGVADVTLRNITYRDVTGEAAKFLNAANNSDRLWISGFRHIGAATAGATHSMTFDGCDDLLLEDFCIIGNFSTAAVGFITTASARITVRSAGRVPSFVWNQNSADVAFVDTITGSTGNFLGPLHLRCTDNAANITEAITGATFCLFDDIYVVNAVNEKAMLINWTASTDA